MDAAAIGMLYLQTAEELDGQPSKEYKERISEVKEHLESSIRGLEFVLRGTHHSDGDFQKMEGLFKVYPELRTLDKPIEHLKGYSEILETLMTGEDSPKRRELMDFLDKIGSRYIGFDIAKSGNCFW